MTSLPDTGYLRLSQVIGRRPVTADQAAANRETGRRGRTPRAGTAPLIPVSAASWYAGQKTGKYPRPVKFGRTALYRVEDIRALIARIDGGAE